MVSQLTRRSLLGLGAAAASAAWVQPVLAVPQLPLLRPDRMKTSPAAAVLRKTRELSLLNTHTDESLEIVYWADGRYEPEALKALSQLLRDHRSDEVHEIDASLLDTLYALRLKLETDETFHVISAYRSPETNAQLREANGGVAKKSYHMRGMAVDIRLPGRALPQLHGAALDIGHGGVGYYPGSDFVHVDVGPVRRWGPRST